MVELLQQAVQTSAVKVVGDATSVRHLAGEVPQRLPRHLAVGAVGQQQLQLQQRHLQRADASRVTDTGGASRVTDTSWEGCHVSLMLEGRDTRAVSLAAYLERRPMRSVEGWGVGCGVGGGMWGGGWNVGRGVGCGVGGGMWGGCHR